MISVCLHFYGVRTPAFHSVKSQLVLSLKNVSHNVHIREVTNVDEILTAKLESVPAIRIPQNNFELYLSHVSLESEFVQSILSEISRLSEQTDKIFTECDTCNGSCYILNGSKLPDTE